MKHHTSGVYRLPEAHKFMFNCGFWVKAKKWQGNFQLHASKSLALHNYTYLGSISTDVCYGKLKTM